MNVKKISAHAVGMALSMLAVWAMNQFAMIVVPAEIAVAFGTIAATVVSLLLPDEMESEQ